MVSRTPLTVGTAVTLAGNLAKGVTSNLPEEDGQYWNRHIDELHTRMREVLFRTFERERSWIDRLVKAENNAHRAFFGQTFDPAQFTATLERFGEDRVGQWAKLGLEPHFFPREAVFSADAKIRGWRVKPRSWFWEEVFTGGIKRRNAAGDLETVSEVRFDGVTLLVDVRCKPPYDGGRQMFVNDIDYLGALICVLRMRGKIDDYGSQSSRFGISPCEWDEQVRPALEARPEFEGVTFRLELVLEANVIPQLYSRMPRRRDGQTNTWVWYEEFMGDTSCRLIGGSSAHGGLADLHGGSPSDHCGSYAVRPVGVLDARAI